jgi:hypothetical protein
MNLIEKIGKKLQEFGLDPLQMEDAKVVESGSTQPIKPNAMIPLNYSEIGKEVTKGEGEKIEDGIYILDNGKKITVIKGLLADVYDIPKPAEAVEGEVKPVEEAPVSGDTKEVKPAEAEVKMAITPTLDKKKIEDLIDITKDGSYTISLSVSNGQIIWGDLHTETYENLVMSAQNNEKVYETKLTEIENGYKTVIESLKMANTKGVENKPDGEAVVNSNKPLTKSDYIKLAIMEKKKNKSC